MKKEIKIRTFFKDVNIKVDGKQICHNFSFYAWELSLKADNETFIEILEYIFDSNISNISITPIEQLKDYFHFYIECDCTALTEDEKLIRNIIKQIKRLQDELLSMKCSAGYSHDYLQRKFKNEYVDIMENNSAKEYLDSRKKES